MNTTLRIVTVGFAAEGTGPRLPAGLRETGWMLMEAPQVPDAAWLRREQADLVVAAQGDAETLARLLRAARAACLPVLWVGGEEDDRSEPPQLLLRLAEARWPLWAYLPAGAPPWAFVAVGRSLTEAARREAQLRERVARLERQLEDRKVIERAKGILMDRFDLSESEAYRRMRETAMRQRKSLPEIARTVVAFEEGRQD